MVQGGGFLCSRPVLSSADGRYLFAATAQTIRVYSTVTGLLVSTLRGHKAQITACVHNPRNNAQALPPLRNLLLPADIDRLYFVQIYSASQDGTIILWDFAEVEVAKTYETGLQIAQMVRSLCDT